MSPGTATVLYALGILGLFLLDRDRNSRISPALWIPVAWLSIAASRMLSDWLTWGAKSGMQSPDEYLEGSPVDQLFLSVLLGAGLVVLVARGQRTGTFLRLNGPILLFFLYASVSVLWSDYPDVAFKRWVKAFGNVVMVLVVMTEPDPTAAIKRLLARTGFLLIPLSVLLIKYYPEMGRTFDIWTGIPYNGGVSSNKNGLGVVCLVFGLGSLWRFLEAFRAGEATDRTRPLIAHGTILAITLWLFSMADSATSFGCFLVGGGLIGLTSLSRLPLRPTALHFLVVGLVFLCFFGLVILPEMGLVEAMGREATLTGRTDIWKEVLSMDVDPWLGTGFESFWLGARAEQLWKKYYWHPNQAHNGYIEIFINLGWAGVALHGLVMAWGYRNVAGALRRDPGKGGLRLAYFVVAAIYNLTEAAFKVTHPVWIAFILAVTAVPGPPRQEDR